MSKSLETQVQSDWMESIYKDFNYSIQPTKEVLIVCLDLSASWKVKLCFSLESFAASTQS